VESVARFHARLDDHQVGESVTITVARDGRQRDVTATLQAGGQ
jgi:S1-C subfamily serine protease